MVIVMVIVMVIDQCHGMWGEIDDTIIVMFVIMVITECQYMMKN